ncbi:MAG: hypothetical protein HQL30_11835 [Candidatus Omnitrophica bacterium]|nr:hypothetical protein [Candidatus Omnitrophota bacterium]
MVNKKTLELIRECNEQIESLYSSLGKFLYQNINSGGLSYYFEPSDVALSLRAKALRRDIVAEKISGDKPAKAKAAAAKASPLAVKVKGAPVKPALRPAPDPVKKASVIVKKKKVETRPAEAAAAPVTGERAKVSLGREKRGQLEPYTKLLVDLYTFKTRLLEIQNDLNGCLALGLLHTESENADRYQNAFNKKIRTITALIGENKEVIKQIMEKKKQFLENNYFHINMFRPECHGIKPASLNLLLIAAYIAPTTAPLFQIQCLMIFP